MLVRSKKSLSRGGLAHVGGPNTLRTSLPLSGARPCRAGSRVDGTTVSPHFGRTEIAQATSGRRVLDVWYQGAPNELRNGSSYVGIQKGHGIANASDLIPDMVLRLESDGQERWLMIETKMGTTRTVIRSARAALLDLLAYQQSFHLGLSGSPTPIGLGIAWGKRA